MTPPPLPIDDLGWLAEGVSEHPASMAREPVKSLAVYMAHQRFERQFITKKDQNKTKWNTPLSRIQDLPPRQFSVGIIAFVRPSLAAAPLKETEGLLFH